MIKPRLEPIGFEGPHGPVNAHFARPINTGSAPAVLLLQEGVGVTKHLLSLALRFANLGIAAFVPDLYSHDFARKRLTEFEVLRALPFVRGADRDVLIASLPREDRESAQRVASWFHSRNTSTYFGDARAAAHYLKRHATIDPDAIATVGFSLGGGLSAQLAAAGLELAAGVIFYGQGPNPAQLAQIRYPLLGHYAQNDPSITPQAEALQQQLTAAGKEFTAHVYPGTEHGFFNESRPVYARDAAELAFTRTLTFLEAQFARGVTRPLATATSTRA
jgi:carboxymethylenebutenolidase